MPCRKHIILNRVEGRDRRPEGAAHTAAAAQLPFVPYGAASDIDASGPRGSRDASAVTRGQER